MLIERARRAFLAGAAEEWARLNGRPPTAEDLDRVLLRDGGRLHVPTEARCRMRAACLAFMADTSHVVGMATNARATEMTNFETLTGAAIRLHEAERTVRIAEIRLNSLVPGVPLRYGVEATRRLRAADVELAAAQIAYDAAQDLPAPEN